LSASTPRPTPGEIHLHYGTEAWFAECARSRRRAALLSCAVALALLAPLVLLSLPAFEAPAESLRRSVRFGVEGDRVRYVRRILLETGSGSSPDAPTLENVDERSERRGGAPERARTGPHGAPPETRARRGVEGEGDAFENLRARALARRSDVPIVESDDLIIERLVRPVYPEQALERNITGRVAVLALVDTTGAVAEVEVVDGAADALLARAAVEAVWQCRFRPYRSEGRVREVYVVIPFHFTLY